MIITREFILQGISEKGSWNNKQILLLGYQYPVRGWLEGAIGKEIPDSDAEIFLSLKNAHLNKRAKNIDLAQDQMASKKEKLVPLEKMVKVEGNIPWKEQYLHPNWQRRRLEIMTRDGFKCMICGNKKESLHVHHNTYDGKYIWECSMRSMITLCTTCHELFHGRKLTQ
jgi:hypothetical protein